MKNWKTSIDVLLVDDDPVSLFLHRKIIERCKLAKQPLSFTNGKELLEFFKMNEHGPAEYLVFLDINMPVMNGWQVLNSLDQVSIKTYMVMVTSSVDEEDRKKAQTYNNVIGFIEKPLTLASIDALGILNQVNE
jgi:CheY-like chemotaxis protein